MKKVSLVALQFEERQSRNYYANDFGLRLGIVHSPSQLEAKWAKFLAATFSEPGVGWRF
jgi:hypothetical protein